MREILFRAKAINRDPNREYRTNYKDGDWVYGLVEKLPFYNENGEKFFEKDCAHMRNISGVSDIDVDENTICEYTGLKDRNGNEIFEGDIVKLAEPKLKIEWNAVVEFGNPNGVYDWGYQLKPITNNAIKYNYNLDILCWVGMEDVNVYCEVIGNIYDNPDLLEGEE